MIVRALPPDRIETARSDADTANVGAWPCSATAPAPKGMTTPADVDGFTPCSDTLPTPAAGDAPADAIGARP